MVFGGCRANVSFLVCFSRGAILLQDLRQGTPMKKKGNSVSLPTCPVGRPQRKGPWGGLHPMQGPLPGGSTTVGCRKAGPCKQHSDTHTHTHTLRSNSLGKSYALSRSPDSTFFMIGSNSFSQHGNQGRTSKHLLISRQVLPKGRYAGLIRSSIPYHW